MNRPNWIGQVLGGRYQIQEIIGQGGMSSVYKAIDPNLRRVVAIKLIHPHLSIDPKFTARFEEEAHAVARLRHPNIVQVYDFNHDDDLYYMVQEFVPGETLQSALRKANKAGQRLNLVEVIRYTTDVCNAIGYAHQQGMIHRDIKPANIMIDERGQAILMDFGIVKLLEGEGHTTTGAVVGTVLYMSPELIRGEKPDPRSDIYSLGVTLFEMLSGRPPFDANSAMTLMMMHQNDPVPDLRQLRPEVPPDLVEIVEKSLRKRREERFNSAAEMAAALKKVLDRLTRSQSLQSTRIEYPADVRAGSPGAPALPTIRLEPGASQPGLASGAASSSAFGQTGAGSFAGSSTFAPNSTGASRTGAGATVAPGSKKAPLVPILAGGGVALIGLVLVCVLAAGLLLRNLLADKQESAVGALVVPTSAPTESPTQAAATPTATATQAPADFPDPTSAPVALVIPTPAVPPGIPFVRLNKIEIDEAGRYVVDYETFEYTEKLPGQHVHFFFNTVPPDQAGTPGKGPWILYGGPRPFKEYKLTDRPEQATQMCALAANPDHSVQPDSGTCYPLPDVTQVIAAAVTDCRYGPGEEYPVLASLETRASALAEGLSPDESWWYVQNPDQPGGYCWVSIATTVLSGDIASLQLVQPPPVPTGGPVIGDTPYVEIKAISLDSQKRYVVEYVAHNFKEALPGMHMHFFFNTTPADQTGMSGGGARLMYGGPTPFTGYTASDRPGDASKLCVLVANPDHTVISDSGNCFQLPDVQAGALITQTDCRANPLQTSAAVATLPAGADVQLLGSTVDRNWVYVIDESSPDTACWIPKTSAQSSGDLSLLPVLGSAPLPTPTKNKPSNNYNY